MHVDRYRPGMRPSVSMCTWRTTEIIVWRIGIRSYLVVVVAVLCHPNVSSDGVFYICS